MIYGSFIGYGYILFITKSKAVSPSAEKHDIAAPFLEDQQRINIVGKAESFNAHKLELIYYHLMFFQRWKEKFFVNVGAECGLTIAGFYYVCFSRSDGSVHGFYYDPNSTYGLHKIYASFVDDIVLVIMLQSWRH